MSKLGCVIIISMTQKIEKLILDIHACLCCLPVLLIIDNEGMVGKLSKGLYSVTSVYHTIALAMSAMHRSLENFLT